MSEELQEKILKEFAKDLKKYDINYPFIEEEILMRASTKASVEDLGNKIKGVWVEVIDKLKIEPSPQEYHTWSEAVDAIAEKVWGEFGNIIKQWHPIEMGGYINPDTFEYALITPGMPSSHIITARVENMIPFHTHNINPIPSESDLSYIPSVVVGPSYSIYIKNRKKTELTNDLVKKLAEAEPDNYTQQHIVDILSDYGWDVIHKGVSDLRPIGEQYPGFGMFATEEKDNVQELIRGGKIHQTFTWFWWKDKLYTHSGERDHIFFIDEVLPEKEAIQAYETAVRGSFYEWPDGHVEVVVYSTPVGLETLGPEEEIFWRDVYPELQKILGGKDIEVNIIKTEEKEKFKTLQKLRKNNLAEYFRQAPQRWIDFEIYESS